MTLNKLAKLSVPSLYLVSTNLQSNLRKVNSADLFQVHDIFLTNSQLFSPLSDCNPFSGDAEKSTEEKMNIFFNFVEVCVSLTVRLDHSAVSILIVNLFNVVTPIS